MLWYFHWWAVKQLSHTRCCCSVAKSCPTLCHPMNCSTPGFPVLHCLSEFVQTHVHWVNDAILCHPLCLLPSIFPSISCGLQILNFCSLGGVPHELGWGLQDLDSAETEKYTLVYSPRGVCFSILTMLLLSITFSEDHGPYFNSLETKNYQVRAGKRWWDMSGNFRGHAENLMDLKTPRFQEGLMN